MNITIKYVVHFFIGFALLALIAACSETGSDSATGKISIPHRSTFSKQVLVKGEALYQKNCAVCHKADASGTTEWRERDKDGKLPPPPLNGTAHTWHHSTAVLKDVIFNGTASTGGNMPAWQGKLTEPEVDAIISWLQTKWPEEIYNTWREIETRSLSDD